LEKTISVPFSCAVSASHKKPMPKTMSKVPKNHDFFWIVFRLWLILSGSQFPLERLTRRDHYRFRLTHPRPAAREPARVSASPVSTVQHREGRPHSQSRPSP